MEGSPVGDLSKQCCITCIGLGLVYSCTAALLAGVSKHCANGEQMGGYVACKVLVLLISACTAAREDM